MSPSLVVRRPVIQGVIVVGGGVVVSGRHIVIPGRKQGGLEQVVEKNEGPGP